MKYLYVFGGRGLYYISGWAWPLIPRGGSAVGLGLDWAGRSEMWGGGVCEGRFQIPG